LRRVFRARRGFQTGVGRTLRYMPPDMTSSSSSYTSTQRTPDVDFEARVDARVESRFNAFFDQMRALNPGLNFPTMPNPSNNDDDEDDDGDN
jgi:hypothetical protein